MNLPEIFDQENPGWRNKVWSPPGLRGMRTKDRETFVPNRYVRRWKEGNEEMLLNALKAFKTLNMRVVFQVQESTDDVMRRNGQFWEAKGHKKKRWTNVRGKTLSIKRIPNQGLFFQLIEEMREAGKRKARE